MGFVTTVAWTWDGQQSLNLLMNNIRPPLNNRNAFIAALNDCIKGFASMRFSYFPPSQSADAHNGFGDLSWQDNAAPRNLRVSFSFNTRGWQQSTCVTMEMLTVT